MNNGNQYKHLVGTDSTDGETSQPLKTQNHEGVDIPSPDFFSIYNYFRQEIKDGAHVIIICAVAIYALSRRAIGKAWESHHSLVKTSVETSIANAEKLKNLEAQTLTQNLRLDKISEDLEDIENLIREKSARGGGEQ